jgi:hypothetical protein
VLGDVGQRLRDDEVRDRLDFIGQSIGQMDVQCRGHACGFGALHHRGQRGVQAAVGEDGRRDAADHVAELDECALGVVVGLGDQLARLREVGVEFGLREADRHRQRDQSGLDAVVQVALDAMPLGLGGRHRALPRLTQGADLVLQGGGGRRRQQPPVDRAVDGGGEHQDGHGGHEGDEGQQPGQRRRDERQVQGVVTPADGHCKGGFDDGDRQQGQCDDRGEDVVDHAEVVMRDRLPERGTADVEP